MRARAIGFNSKLVRLKGDLEISVEELKASFNSKLVRLKVLEIIQKSCHRSRRFQFQTGAIKRLTFLMRKSMRPTRFNSKLVRLKGRSEKSRSPRRSQVSIPNWCD